MISYPERLFVATTGTIVGTGKGVNMMITAQAARFEFDIACSVALYAAVSAVTTLLITKGIDYLIKRAAKRRNQNGNS